MEHAAPLEHAVRFETAPHGTWGILGCVFFAIFGLIALAGFAFWLWMLIDAATRCPSRDNLKLIWILVILLGSLIGAVVYFFVQRPKNPPPGAPPAGG